MARYDRIARLPVPDREAGFPGWNTLRDLEHREREPELGRRARLRFLALRPVLRLLARGLEAVDASSFERQLESVREELGHLPPRDHERNRIAEYLKAVGGRSPGEIARATINVGGAAEAGGHPHAAEEFYRTALQIAESYDLVEPRLRALRRIATVLRNRGEVEAAVSNLERAADFAESHGELVEWARAMDAMAVIRLRQGDAGGAGEILGRVDERGRASRNERVRAVAAAGRCALEIAAGSPEAAVEAGWEAIDRMEPDDEERNRVLLNMGAAFRRLGLQPAAASCYVIIERWAAWPEHRIEAKVESAALAAEAGDVDAFREHAAGVLPALDRADAQTVGLAMLGLGRAAMLLRHRDTAREYLRRAIGIARDEGDETVLAGSEGLLAALEQDEAAGVAASTAPASDGSRSIARRMEALSRQLV